MSKRNIRRLEELARDRFAWERQPYEGMRRYRIFCAYKDLGPNRSLRKAGMAFYGLAWGPGKLGYIEYLSPAWKWVERAAAFDAEQATLLENKEQAEREESRRRRINFDRSLMKFAWDVIAEATKPLPKGATAKQIMTKERLTVDHAIRMIKLGMDGERLELGEPSEISEVRGAGGVMVYLPENGRQDRPDSQEATEGDDGSDRGQDIASAGD